MAVIIFTGAYATISSSCVQAEVDFDDYKKIENMNDEMKYEAFVKGMEKKSLEEIERFFKG